MAGGVDAVGGMKKPSGPIIYTIEKGADVWPFRAIPEENNGFTEFAIFAAVVFCVGVVVVLVKWLGG
jgi:hypothetical protein